jgi:tagatose 6-phosphate kinase
LGILHDFIKVNEESRICLNIIDEMQSSSTEILETGPLITSEELVSIKIKVAELARLSTVIAFSGSLPKGMPSSTYAELIKIASEQGATVFLDTSGEALRLSIASKPFFIKPNEIEIADLTGKAASTDEELFQSIHVLMDQGITCVSVSLGEKGSITGYRNKLYRAAVPPMKVVNAVGCGDAFVAGMISGFNRQEPIIECIRLAAAMGSAAALSQQAGYIKLEEVERIKALVKIEEIGYNGVNHI